MSLHHFSDATTTCVVLAGGDIVIIQDQDGSGDAHIEIVGSIDAGITAARWSPDEEVLVITTAEHAVVFMSRSFDPIAEATMTADDLQASKHVSVGWGKKETQFQGRGAKAKALRDPTIPEKVDEGALSAKDDGRTTISWRGDGTYVAINAVEVGVRRVVRVYTREGVLDSVSEPVDGLEGSLSWRPSGNLLAGVQRLADRIDVVFFERNGLRHGQFSLRVPNDSRSATEDISLDWNTDSTALAVVLKDRVQLWTTGNYHWYLKQEILCGENQPHISWHSEKALQLGIATDSEFSSMLEVPPMLIHISEKLIRSDYILSVARGPTLPPYDYGVVGVIDGQTAKFTPFRTANVPPPMSLFDVEAESSIVDIAISSDSTYLAILHNLGVDLYTFGRNESRILAPKLTAKVPIPNREPDLYEEAVLRVSFSGDRSFEVLRAGGTATLLSYNFAAPEGGWVEGNAGSMAGFASTHLSSANGAIAQDHSGQLFRVVNGEREKLQLPDKFPSLLPWTEVVEHGDQFLAFGLSRNGHLYAGSRQLAKNCTSFLVTRDHLIYTTTNHLVKFIHLAGPDGNFPCIPSFIRSTLTNCPQTWRFLLMILRPTNDAGVSSVERDLSRPCRRA